MDSENGVVHVDDLTDAGRAAVWQLARLLSERFTGEIVIIASEGGVRTFRAGKQWSGESLTHEMRGEAA